MTTEQRRFLSAILGAALLAVLLLVVSLDDLYRPEPPETVTLREVQRYLPPPPPPARPLAQQGAASDAGTVLTLANREDQIALQIMALDVELPRAELGDVSVGTGDLGYGPGTGRGMVSLSELDRLPTLISSPAFTYPKELVAANVNEFTVVFEILIDETGRTFPVRIIENPYPQFAPQLERYASRARFSPPTKLGITVRTQYRWPVLFKRP